MEQKNRKTRGGSRKRCASPWRSYRGRARAVRGGADNLPLRGGVRARLNTLPPKVEYNDNFKVRNYLERYAHYHGILLVRVPASQIRLMLSRAQGSAERNLVEEFIESAQAENVCWGNNPVRAGPTDNYISDSMEAKGAFTIFAYAKKTTGTRNSLIGFVIYKPMDPLVQLNLATHTRDVLTFGTDDEDEDLNDKKVLEVTLMCRRKPREARTAAGPTNTGKFLFFYALSLAQLQVKTSTNGNVENRDWRYNRVILELLGGNLAPQALITSYTNWGLSPVNIWSRGTRRNVRRGVVIPLAPNPNVHGVVNYFSPGEAGYDPSYLNMVSPAQDANGDDTLELDYRKYFMEYPIVGNTYILTLATVTGLFPGPFALPDQFNPVSDLNRCVDRVQCR